MPLEPRKGPPAFLTPGAWVWHLTHSDVTLATLEKIRVDKVTKVHVYFSRFGRWERHTLTSVLGRVYETQAAALAGIKTRLEADILSAERRIKALRETVSVPYYEIPVERAATPKPLILS